MDPNGYNLAAAFAVANKLMSQQHAIETGSSKRESQLTVGISRRLQISTNNRIRCD